MNLSRKTEMEYYLTLIDGHGKRHMWSVGACSAEKAIAKAKRLTRESSPGCGGLKTEEIALSVPLKTTLNRAWGEAHAAGLNHVLSPIEAAIAAIEE